MKKNYFFIAFFFLTSYSFPAEHSIADLPNASEPSGNLLIYSVLSNKAAEPLLIAFQNAYPNIRVKYQGDTGSNEINAQFENEIKANGESADVMWSSAVDAQMNFIHRGFARNYLPKDADFLPSWAIHKNLAWGTTFEPVVFVYNKNALSETLIPKSHHDFQEILSMQSNVFRKKITLFDPNKSSVGMFFKTQDFKFNPKAIDLYKALESVEAFGSAGTGEMLTKINSADFLFGYNIMGSYALSRSKKDLKNIAIIYPSDYTLVLTRVAFISKFSKNPHAAEKWIDFLLSSTGQKILADQVELNSIRSDIDSKNTAHLISTRIGHGATPVDISN